MVIKTYRMKALDIIGWTLYMILTKAIYPAIILLVGSIIYIVFSLDRALHVNYRTAFIIYVLLTAVYIIYKVVDQVITVSLDDSKMTIKNFYRKYQFYWRDIKSIREIVEKPGAIGISTLAGDSSSPIARKTLVIETASRKFNIELSQNSFGIETVRMPLDIKKYKEGQGGLEEGPVITIEKVTFYSENDAFDFFIKRIEREAEVDGMAISGPELKMLRYSVENETDETKDEKEFKETVKNYRDLSEFEGRIIYLMKRAYDREMFVVSVKAAGEMVKDNYRQARDILKKKDNYMNVIIDRALGRDLAKGWERFFR